MPTANKIYTLDLVLILVRFLFSFLMLGFLTPVIIINVTFIILSIINILNYDTVLLWHAFQSFFNFPLWEKVVKDDVISLNGILYIYSIIFIIFTLLLTFFKATLSFILKRKVSLNIKNRHYFLLGFLVLILTLTSCFLPSAPNGSISIIPVILIFYFISLIFIGAHLLTSYLKDKIIDSFTAAPAKTLP